MFFIEVRMNGLNEVLKGLIRVSRMLSTGGADAVGRRLSREGMRIVERLTPRQRNTHRAPSTKRGYPPFHKQWELIERMARTSVYEALIRNKAAAGGPTTQGFMALAAVERGARPHIIRPRNAQFLMWDQPRHFRLFVERESDSTRPLALQGTNLITDAFIRRTQERDVVMARQVRHPGHKGFRMVQETRTMLETIANRLLVDYAKQIQQVFGGGFTIGVN